MINNQIQTQLSSGLDFTIRAYMTTKYDLEDRLVGFASDMICFTRSFPREYAADRIKEQITRSSLSTALNYGEAQAAESKRDFRHKCSIVLKELKESRVGLKIITRLNLGKTSTRILIAKECEELIAIFASIIKRTTT